MPAFNFTDNCDITSTRNNNRANFFNFKKNSFKAITALFLLAALSGCQGLLGKSEADLAEERRLEALKNPCVVLALPASGRYAAFANKIKNGANIAGGRLKAAGINLRLENINTESPDWLARLNALPPMCAVVGGPIQDRKYEEARKSGALEKRIFFSFVPTLHQGDEGKLAWRFFPSPADQINALVRFATDQLKIHTYGAFYPADNYGARMTALLENALARRGMKLQKASYNPAAPATWSDSVKTLIQPTTREGSRTPLPNTAFEAIFLPDSWKNMDMLTTSMLYNGEDRLVLLGTSLWEQALAGRRVPKAEKYVLAVFPAVWDPTRAPAPLRNASADMWVALGYDFVNFAARSGLAERSAAGHVTSAAQKAAAAISALAPISWNNDGMASQNLYLFQVGPQGAKPLNLDAFRLSRSAVLDRAAARALEMPAETQPEDVSAAEENEAPMTGAAPAANTPAPVSAPEPDYVPPRDVQPYTPPLSTVPQPSYKLRLPGRP